MPNQASAVTDARPQAGKLAGGTRHDLHRAAPAQLNALQISSSENNRALSSATKPAPRSAERNLFAWMLSVKAVGLKHGLLPPCQTIACSERAPPRRASANLRVVRLGDLRGQPSPRTLAARDAFPMAATDDVPVLRALFAHPGQPHPLHRADGGVRGTAARPAVLAAADLECVHAAARSRRSWRRTPQFAGAWPVAMLAAAAWFVIAYFVHQA